MKNIELLWTEFTESFYGISEVQYSDKIKMDLETAINQLKPAYRDIIIAVDFEGYSYREIANETGIAQGTLIYIRHRAISVLLKKLEK